ncbi:GAF domain-containing sensor histidine kinase [Actinoallomurus vinaceus]|uniref:GAF domain-containing sensor histidine kinase n=1 Tax=Actinoallomurus vinaceus TaxID=1080074 RepID=UPI0031ECB217
MPRRLLRRLGMAWDRLYAPEPANDELRRIVNRERAFRRVATLVAGGASPSAVFTAVAGEMGRLLGADHTMITRYRADRTLTLVAKWSSPDLPELDVPFGGRWVVAPDTPAGIVVETGWPARRTADSIESDLGPWARAHGLGAGVAGPITVEDRLWGVITTLYREANPPPDDAEQRMAEFVRMLNCAIAQADARAELIACHARMVTAADAVRQSVAADLNDGPQQCLKELTRQLQELQAGTSDEGLRRHLSRFAEAASEIEGRLRQVSTDLLSVAPAKGGMEATLRALTRRCPVPVDLNVPTGQELAERVEATVYHIVAEGLLNAIRHAHASAIRIDLSRDGEGIRLSINDDGVGGAHPLDDESGLAALKKRVEVLGGSLQVESPVGDGTSLAVTLPCSA